MIETLKLWWRREIFTYPNGSTRVSFHLTLKAPFLEAFVLESANGGGYEPRHWVLRVSGNHKPYATFQEPLENNALVVAHTLVRGFYSAILEKLEEP